MTSALPIPKFADNFWESLEKNGITILIERMRGAKQTCERYKHAYEARAILEEEYGKTLSQIAQKQKASSTENGSSKLAMDTLQDQFQSVAESHLQLAEHLRENVALPLTNLLNKQRVLRKELQTSIQKLYNNRQIQVHFVRRAHKRHNLEIEKANLLVQQQLSEKDKRATFRTAENTIDKLKKVYEEALSDLSKIVEEWNIEWRKTCESFEKLEQERLEFFKANISNCANLIIASLEGEIQAHEKMNEKAMQIDVAQDLVQFVKLNKSSDIVPTPMEYIKLHAYHEANQDRGDLKYTHNAIRDNIDNEDQDESEERVHVHINRKRSNTATSHHTKPIVEKYDKPLEHTIIASPVAHIPQVEAPVMMVGVMEVYASGEDDDTDDEDCEYVTETESEAEEEEEKPVIAKKEEPIKEQQQQRVQEVTKPVQSSPVQVTNEEPMTTAPPARAMIRPVSTTERQPSDEKVDRLMSAFQKEIKREKSPVNQQQQPSMLMSKNNGFNPSRRVSFIDSNNQVADQLQQMSSARETHCSMSSVDRFSPPVQTPDEDYLANSEDAAFELDDMLRELDSKRIIRDGAEDSIRYRQQEVKPTASISSPSLLQKQQQRRSNIPSSHYFSATQKPQQSTRRMSTIESPSYSRQSSFGTMNSSTRYMDIYDPFNTLSSKETGGESSVNSIQISQNKKLDSGSMRNSKLDHSPPSAQSIHDRLLKQQRPVSLASSSSGSIRSVEPSSQGNSFYTKTPSPENTTRKQPNTPKFIDFALALYDYEEADEGEISFKEGDLLGIISKSEEDDEQGWWEASLLNRRNQRVVKTGLVPSNFLETVSK